MDSSLKYWVWLSSLVKIPPRKRFELLEHFKDPAFIWEATEEELKKLSFTTQPVIDRLIDRQTRKETRTHMERLVSNDIDIITFHDRAYPEYLKNIHDPPAAIFVKGKLTGSETCIAVVGSRRATAYGLNTAESLAYELSGYGITVVSGMARGIDSRAHLGALNAGGRTIAVLGCGLDIVYPYENKELMKRIYRNGAVISEFLPGIPPIPFNFPARNRIISGISYGVAVIEANEKSGSLITANYALEQGRDVFAVPGNISSSNSTGTNRLIRDGAKIVIDVGDILDELKIFHGANNTFCSKKNRLQLETLDMEERSIAEKLADGPAHIDNIARVCLMDIQVVSSVLVMLELRGVVRQLPGKLYELLE